MNLAPSPRIGIRVGEWDLDLETGELRKPGAALRLQEQPLQILQMLMERPGTVVSREDLRKRIWPADTFVDFDHGLYSAVKRLRDAIGDSTEKPIYIQTLSRRGYRLIAPVTALPEANSPPPSSAREEVPDVGKRVPRKFWVAVFAILGAAALVAVFLGPQARDFRGRLFGGTAAKPITSIAVLPLQNLSADPDQEYFAAGMTDELITDLAQIGELRVISRTSVMHYKGTQKTLPQIARELNVDAVVEGTVARSGDRVRIRVQLVRAEDDRHLWAHAYERQLQDVLLLQSDAARDIARQISTKLNVSSGSGRWSRARPVKPEAFEAYLKGRYFWTRRSEDSNVRAIAYFEQAIRQDPESALGYSGLADAQLDRVFIVGAPPQDAAGQARVVARKALEIDPALAESHVSLAEILEVYDWNWVEAEKEYRRAMDLDPNYVPAHQFYALYLAGMGRFEQAIEEARLAQDLDPVSPFAYATGGLVSALARQYDRAAEQNHKALEIDPNFTTAHGNLYSLYIRTGMYDQALEEFEKWAPLRGISPETSVALRRAYRKSGIMGFFRKSIELDNRRIYPQLNSVERAAIHVKLGEKTNALDYLDKACKERNPWMENLSVDPVWDDLRSEPRFREIVHSVGLPQ